MYVSTPTPRRIAFLPLAATAVLAVAACGSGGGSHPASPSAAASTVSGRPVAATTPPSAAKAPGGELTPPGAQLALGAQAKVGWVPPSGFTTAKAQPGIRLEVSVDSIEKGAIGDFKNVQLDATQRASTPYYVKVHLRSHDSTGAGSDNPGLAFQAIDDRGQQQHSVTFIGDFPRCPDNQPPKQFTHGKSYAICLTYLMPGGGSIDEVHWSDGPSKAGAVTPYFDKPIVWKGG